MSSKVLARTTGWVVFIIHKNADNCMRLSLVRNSVSELFAS